MIYVLLGWIAGEKVPRGFSTHTDFNLAIQQFRMMSDSYQYKKVTFNRLDVSQPFEPKVECLGKWEAGK